MTDRTEISEFLSTRRARITPEQAGVPLWGGQRRVSGLRREEVALLAGVSTDYYARLERGNLQGVSESVLDALARALQLDEAERGHLFDLARTANQSPRAERKPRSSQIRPGVQRTIEAIVDAPAFVISHRRDILAENDLGRALYSALYDEPSRPVNTARFTFLSPQAHTFFLDWSKAADDTVANLRTEAGRNPFDKGLTDLVGELATRSDEFRSRWASHNVRYHHTGLKGIHHPVVGDLNLSFEVMDLPADAGQSLIVYNAEAGSPAADGLKLLASWAAGQREAEQQAAGSASGA